MRKTNVGNCCETNTINNNNNNLNYVGGILLGVSSNLCAVKGRYFQRSCFKCFEPNFLLSAPTPTPWLGTRRTQWSLLDQEGGPDLGAQIRGDPGVPGIPSQPQEPRSRGDPKTEGAGQGTRRRTGAWLHSGSAGISGTGRMENRKRGGHWN